MSQLKIKEDLHTALQAASNLTPTWTEDMQNNQFGWLRLGSPAALEPVANALVTFPAAKARLMTVTAYARQKDDPAKKRSISYHFDLAGLTLTLSVPIFDENDKKLPVPSITRYFRNASWNEREFHEMFNIEIIGHPNPKRLFLDERIDAGVMSSLIPYSAMVHGASSKELWEKVMEAKTGARFANQKELIKEPDFTPVSATEPAKPADAGSANPTKEGN